MGTLRTCDYCGAEFTGRKNGRFCTVACRTARKPSSAKQAVSVTGVDAILAAALDPDVVALAVSADRVLYDCCKHCPSFRHARHADPCRQGCS